jgi:prepilin-type processing-associated H-X9-DG protein
MWKEIWLVLGEYSNIDTNFIINMQWIVIDSKVYDLSRFADLHPGGANVLYADAVGEIQVSRLSV